MKKMIWLTALLPISVLANPASENGINAVQAAIEAQTPILEQIEANTANGNGASTINALYVNCDNLYLMQTGYRMVNQNGTIRVGNQQSSSPIDILPPRATNDEGRDDLLEMFNVLNGTSFTMADVGTVNGFPNCQTLNSLLLGISFTP